ncbi:MAG TPA: tetratricopeptide repeat protein, partial [Bacteroidetes bacterium]|nr:tetratricopeptide repeat protein [Bacteroidota bacterium]
EIRSLAKTFVAQNSGKSDVKIRPNNTGFQAFRSEDRGQNKREATREPTFESLPPRVRYLVMYSIALASYRTGEYAKARILFRDLIQINPESPYADNAAYWIGRSYENEGKLNQAIDAYVRASNLPDGDRRPYAWINIAACFFKLGQYDRGKAVLRELVKRYPNYRMEPVLTGLLAQLAKAEKRK